MEASSSPLFTSYGARTRRHLLFSLMTLAGIRLFLVSFLSCYIVIHSSFSWVAASSFLDASSLSTSDDSWQQPYHHYRRNHHSHHHSHHGHHGHNLNLHPQSSTTLESSSSPLTIDLFNLSAIQPSRVSSLKKQVRSVSQGQFGVPTHHQLQSAAQAAIQPHGKSWRFSFFFCS